MRPTGSRIPRLPERPVRTFLRFLVRAAVAWVAVSLDFERHKPEPIRPRPAREIAQEARRRSQP